MRKQLALALIGLIILLGSTGCLGRMPGVGGGPGRAATPGPASADAPPTAAPARAAEPADEPTAAPQASTSSGSTASSTLSESQYKDQVSPIMRRLRQNGLDSLNLSSPVSSCSAIAEPRGRAVRLREELNDIERDLNELANPSSLQRAQDDLGRAVQAQKESLDLSIEALDNCSNRSTLVDRLQRSQSRLLDARNAWEDARRALNINL